MNENQTPAAQQKESPETRNVRELALDMIRDERARQDKKWGEQNHDMMTWLAILQEETGELSQASLHKKFGGHAAGSIMAEAIQTAAVACQIVEYLLRQEFPGISTNHTLLMAVMRHCKTSKELLDASGITTEAAVNSMRLEALREAQANEAFQAFNFGSDIVITDSDGWTKDGRYWSRKVYGDESPDGKEPSHRIALSFGVEFEEGGHEVVEKWSEKFA
jgi:NTP pyrophosphatase (non-canonical NTP hydrolase)